MSKNELNKLKKWLFEFLPLYTDDDGNESLIHSCNYHHDPMKGHCDDCEMFVKLNQLFEKLEDDCDLLESASNIFKLRNIHD